MFNLNFKKIAILVVIISAVLLVFLKNGPTINTPQLNDQVSSANTQDESPKIISTKPDPLDNAIISASEVVEITFSHPLENTGEFKHRIDPKPDYKLELTQDRKTLKIIPQKPYELGNTYTLFISPESKFDGGLRLDGEKIFHFRTVRYRGI